MLGGYVTVTKHTNTNKQTPLARPLCLIANDEFNNMAYNEDSSASGHDEPWIQW